MIFVYIIVGWLLFDGLIFILLAWRTRDGWSSRHRRAIKRLDFYQHSDWDNSWSGDLRQP